MKTWHSINIPPIRYNVSVLQSATFGITFNRTSYKNEIHKEQVTILIKQNVFIISQNFTGLINYLNVKNCKNDSQTANTPHIKITLFHWQINAPVGALKISLYDLCYNLRSDCIIPVCNCCDRWLTCSASDCLTFNISSRRLRSSSTCWCTAPWCDVNSPRLNSCRLPITNQPARNYYYYYYYYHFTAII